MKRKLPKDFEYKTIYGKVDSETFYNEIVDAVFDVMHKYGFGVGASEVAYTIHKVAEYIDD